MIRRLLGAGALTLMTPLVSSAQDAGSSSEGITPTAADERAADSASIEKVPGWSIKPEIETLGSSMKKFNTLIGSLGRANKDLSDEFAKYVLDPKNEVVASTLERKMADYAAQVQGKFSKVIAEQDALSSSFRMVRRKLEQLSTRIGTKAGSFQDRSKAFSDEARRHEKTLVDLAVELKESPPEDPDELEKLKHEFLLKQRRYMLKQRYVKGYEARLASYQQLRKNIDKLGELFVTLHERFGDLMENLADEKRYLRESMELQADAARIKQIMREGFFGGENALENVSEKLASLYVKVDAFTQVHDRINSDMSRFVESQTKLAEVSSLVEGIGGQDFGHAQSVDLEKSIDEFYKKKDQPLTNDDDSVVKGVPREGR
jgi:hypothetical protein